MMNNIADVVVADGFSGNVALKTTEGTASFMNKQLKAMFKANILTKFAALLMMKQITGEPRESYSKPSMSIVQWEGKHSINWKEKQIPTQLYCLPTPSIR